MVYWNYQSNKGRVTPPQRRVTKMKDELNSLVGENVVVQVKLPGNNGVAVQGELEIYRFNSNIYRVDLKGWTFAVFSPENVEVINGNFIYLKQE
jgi:hypothetical protein